MKLLTQSCIPMFLLVLMAFGCKHPSEPSSAPPIISMLDGAVLQLDTLRSNFDTTIWLPDTGLQVQLDAANTTHDTITNSASYYWFYHLNIQDATLKVAQPGFASVTVLHAQNENSYPKQPANYSGIYASDNILLAPNSWLQVTLEGFRTNMDTSIISKRVGVEADARGDTTNFGTLILDTEIYSYGVYTDCPYSFHAS